MNAARARLRCRSAARRRAPEPIVAGAVADPRVMGYLKLYKERGGRGDEQRRGCMLHLRRAAPAGAAAARPCLAKGSMQLCSSCWSAARRGCTHHLASSSP